MLFESGPAAAQAAEAAQSCPTFGMIDTDLVKNDNPSSTAYAPQKNCVLRMGPRYCSRFPVRPAVVVSKTRFDVAFLLIVRGVQSLYIEHRRRSDYSIVATP